AGGVLERLLTEEARWEECTEVLSRKADGLENPGEEVDVLLQAAQVWEDKLGEKQRAAHVYERVLSVDPANMTASLQLEQIYRDEYQWEKLIELLLGRGDDTPAAAPSIALLQ